MGVGEYVPDNLWDLEEDDKDESTQYLLDAQVEEWHAEYIERLTALFDRHKARFGYADRELEIF